MSSKTKKEPSQASVNLCGALFLLICSGIWYFISSGSPDAYDKVTTFSSTSGGWSTSGTSRDVGLFVNMEWQTAAVGLSLLLTIAAWIAYKASKTTHAADLDNSSESE